MAEQFSLAKHGITVEHVSRNSIPAALYEKGLVGERGTAITSTGALVALSGANSHRSVVASMNSSFETVAVEGRPLPLVF